MEASPTGNTNPTNTRQSNSSSGGKGYTFLAPLPTAESQSFTSLADYMVYIYITLIGLAIIFAVIMVVWGGVQYVLGALTSDKEGGKKKIQMAVLGLLLVLLSYLILLAINPMLLKVGLNIQHITLPGRSDSGSDTDDGGGGNDNGDPNDGNDNLGRGNCSVLPEGNHCSTSALSSSFPGREKTMSSICNLESAGGNPNAESQSDCVGRMSIHGPTCRALGLPSFSIGLFQINLTNTNTLASGWGVDCTKAFRGQNAQSTIVDRGLYDRCVGLAKDPTNNINAAKMLYYSKRGSGVRGVTPWSYTAHRCGFL